MAWICTSSRQDRKVTRAQEGVRLMAAVSQVQGLRSPENQLLPRRGHHEMWTWTHLSAESQQTLPTCSVPRQQVGHT